MVLIGLIDRMTLPLQSISLCFRGSEVSTLEILTTVLRTDQRDLGKMLEIPFFVTETLDSISVRVGVRHAKSVTLDLGLKDPTRIRGWSGSARQEIFISAHTSTPGYLAGDLQVGEWAVLLSPYQIEEEVEVEIAIEGVVFSPKWLKADLHTHSTHSDGAWQVQELLSRAIAIGLDVVALSDHNTVTQNFEAQCTSQDDPNVLIIPAMEWTTRMGHANVFGLCDPLLDWRVEEEDEFLEKVATLKSKGALVSANHPCDDFAMGIKWQWPLQELDFLEIWNGPWRDSCSKSRELWIDQLKSGRRVVALGGSDVHGPSPWVELGSPTTHIYVTKPGLTGVLEGLSKGSVYITSSPSGPHLAPESTVPGESVDSEVHVVIEGLQVGNRVNITTQRGLLISETIDTTVFKRSFQTDDDCSYVRIEAYRHDDVFDVWLPLLITNPIWNEGETQGIAYE
jgi:hypothetical protein